MKVLPDTSMLLWCTMSRWGLVSISTNCTILILSHQFSACLLPRRIPHEPRGPWPLVRRFRFRCQRRIFIQLFLNTCQWRGVFKVVNKFFWATGCISYKQGMNDFSSFVSYGGKSLVRLCSHWSFELNWIVNSPAADEHAEVKEIIEGDLSSGLSSYHLYMYIISGLC
jgi:hypothetical protein